MAGAAALSIVSPQFGQPDEYLGQMMRMLEQFSRNRILWHFVAYLPCRVLEDTTADFLVMRWVVETWSWTLHCGRFAGYVGNMKMAYVAANLGDAILHNKCLPSLRSLEELRMFTAQFSPFAWLLHVPPSLSILFYKTHCLVGAMPPMNGIIVAGIVIVTRIIFLTKTSVELTSGQSISRRCAAFVAHNA